MSRSTDFGEFFDAVYDAALDDRKWDSIVSEISARFPYTVSSFAFYDGQVDQGEMKIFGEFSDDAIATYEQYYAAVNPWVEINMQTPVGPVTRSSDFLPIDQFLKTEFYNDWLRYHDGVDEALGCTLFREQDRLALFGVHYRSDLITTEEYATLHSFLSRAAPHLQRAIDLRRKLAGATIYANTLEAAFDRFQIGVALAKSDGAIRFANREADRIFSLPNSAVTCRNRRLKLSKSSMQEELQSAIRMATSSAGQNDSAARCIFRLVDNEERAFVINVFPLVANLPGETMLTYSSVFSERHALIFKNKHKIAMMS